MTFSNPTGEIATADVRSAWRIDIPARPDGVPVFTVSTGGEAIPSPEEDTVTCRVLRYGELVQENTATGTVASADCSTY